jgi:hypothetical protein
MFKAAVLVFIILNYIKYRKIIFSQFACVINIMSQNILCVGQVTGHVLG